ncbi:hypothetical protein [Microbacterium terricola]|uniref:Uncharacterized protein n=1 Tax=Microbacterium terricola TaxID=344163 RepID=A0ABM8DYL7_9MICO|nr:hypothetical protein [Microbacterium terricola]UYK41505.1 hypothetical protein OAU46_07730 [Microbacterium terricola]BDV30704.1 hypothetical protein Microterr_13640 [Microbacterium terricola]
MNRRSRLSALLSLSVLGLVLSACATPAASSGASDAAPGLSLGSTAPGPPAGEVIGQGTVMDEGGSVELCLGAIAESYPPQCSGIPLENWSWDGVDGSESSGDVTWGAYAVQGTYDGDTFTRTQAPIMLALYDPMMAPDPTGGEPGTTDEAALLDIQAQVTDRLGPDALATTPQDGYLWVDVVWDDGTWQQAADDDFGAGVVIIRSALQEIAG